MDIRAWFRNTFGDPYVLLLEEDRAYQRNDFTRQLQERDRVISDLKVDKQALQNRVNQLEAAVLPCTSRAGADLVRAISPSTSEKPKPNFGPAGIPPVKSEWERAQEEFRRIEDEIAATNSKAVSTV